MSSAAVDYVFKESTAKNTARLMLLAMADESNDAGECKTSIKTLAAKCAVDDRSAKRLVRQLEKLGEIETKQNAGEKTSSGRTNLYVLKRFLSVRGGKSVTSQEVVKSSPLTSEGVVELSPLDDIRGGKIVTPSHSDSANVQVQGVVKSSPINNKKKDIDKSGKSKQRAKPYHDVDAKVIDQFITTWIAEQPATPLEDHYGNDTTRTIVASLIRAALTTDDLTRYMRVKYKESWWKDKPMNWKHIQQYLPAWAKAHPAKPVTNGTYMDDLSLWRLEDMKRQEEEMRRNAG